MTIGSTDGRSGRRTGSSDAANGQQAPLLPSPAAWPTSPRESARSSAQLRRRERSSAQSLALVLAESPASLLGRRRVSQWPRHARAAAARPTRRACRARSRTAGCTLQVEPALEGAHSIATPGAVLEVEHRSADERAALRRSRRSSAIYEDELEQARVVHDLEHGGVFIQYGNDVPESTVDQLRDFYADHTTGTVMAPLDRARRQVRLGAWVVDGDNDGKGQGFLAKCPAFDDGAFSTFFGRFQFRGPERFARPSSPVTEAGR